MRAFRRLWYLERHPELREFQKDLREEIVDKAESNLMIGLRQGRQWSTSTRSTDPKTANPVLPRNFLRCRRAACADRRPSDFTAAASAASR